MDANERAAARSKAGLPRELEQLRDNNAPHPRRGGSAGYPLWHREEIMNHAAQHGIQATANHYGISRMSIMRWNDRIIPYRQTGGLERQDLVGSNLLLMAIWLFIWPSSTADQTGAFIFNNGGGLYSREAISERMKDLEMMRKKASTEAYQEFNHINRLKAEWFWSLPPLINLSEYQ